MIVDVLLKIVAPKTYERWWCCYSGWALALIHQSLSTLLQTALSFSLHCFTGK